MGTLQTLVSWRSQIPRIGEGVLKGFELKRLSSLAALEGECSDEPVPVHLMLHLMGSSIPFLGSRVVGATCSMVHGRAVQAEPAVPERSCFPIFVPELLTAKCATVASDLTLQGAKA